MIFSILLYALCLIVSSIGAWTDIKTGRVRNAYLLIAAGTGLVLYIVALIFEEMTWFDLPRWAINFGLSIALSIVFYLSDIWAPGDAKLFILIAGLFPQEFYATQPANIFPSLSIVVFAYAIGYIFLVIAAISNRNNHGEKMEKIILDRAFLVCFLINVGVIIGLSTIMNALLPTFYATNQTLALLCMVGLCYVVQRRWPKVLTLIGVAGLLATVILTVVSREYRALLISLPLSLLLALLTQLLVRMADSNSYHALFFREEKTIS